MPGGISYINELVIDASGEIASQAIGDKALKTTAADADTLEVDAHRQAPDQAPRSSLAMVGVATTYRCGPD